MKISLFVLPASSNYAASHILLIYYHNSMREPEGAVTRVTFLCYVLIIRDWKTHENP